ncbi:MAG TPA: hypothetical protein VLE97_09610 [Gaiellaceae bacterium]|nr:hypothetical protein [Gaiellaceae bacterium]
MPDPVPTFDQVYEWCEQHDSHPTEGWLLALLDGTYSVDELRAAILADRSPEEATTLAATTKSLANAVLDLPDYRGWSVNRQDDYAREMDDRFVWKHDDRDEKIWFDIVQKSKEQIALSINVDDPNDDPYHPRGSYELLAEHTAAAVFAALKPLLDEYSSDEDEAEAG